MVGRGVSRLCGLRGNWYMYSSEDSGHPLYSAFSPGPAGLNPSHTVSVAHDHDVLPRAPPGRPHSLTFKLGIITLH